MAVFIIGASGLIGGELHKKCSALDHAVIGTCTSNKNNGNLVYLDLCSNHIDDFCDKIGSEDTVFIMSAYSNPSWIYENKAKATELNLTGTKRLIDRLAPKMPHLVFMSSVEIFDGQKGGYKENDAGNPLNYYGQMKLDIEHHLKQNYDRHTIVRTGWNIGNDIKSRCVVSLTYETLLKSGAKMADDNYFSVIAASDTAEALSRLIDRDEIKIIHIASDAIIGRTYLANKIITESISGDKMKFDVCRFADIKYTEARGRVNDLDNTRSKELLGMTYLSADAVISAKIKLLDAHHANAAIK